MAVAGEQFAPGSLVRARGREWIVLPGSDGETLRLRPLAGGESDGALIHLPLELDPVTPASFAPPLPDQRSGQDGALLLRDALLLSLRRGAGPFRSFGNVGVEPRAYQLVPLLMALKLDPVRLLIADDVGIGKTIEAGLIARELLDRGEISRMAVICPPHLVDQWVRELDARFNLKAAAVTATSAARLERGLPMGEGIFDVHPFAVVSLDYIKSDRRRADFVRACPEFVIVDEAHTCTMPGQGRHQRFELLRQLADDPARHVVMLTATPHSGNEEAFYRLLGLLNPEFQHLGAASGGAREALRERLGAHFVQRRRPDIEEWQHERVFAKRQVAELTYRLTGDWQALFESVLGYCREVVERAGGDERRQRLTFWGTLALLRCVSSSPAAAAQALRTRAQALGADGGLEEDLAEAVFDGAADALPESDVEPSAPAEDGRLGALVAQARRLAGEEGDPKLKSLLDHLKTLVADGFNPVVFCRYVATAHYVAEHLRGRFKGVDVAAVTGELAAEEREEAIEQLGEADRRILVATDCLSEGINLQEHFDSVVHYDLSWNPTRHEQREGRVDRFGQPREVVRATLIYGENNPVDAAVLKVILRKAEKIRRDLGVPVPLPDDGFKLTQALMHEVLLRRGVREQMAFDFAPDKLPQSDAIENVWRDAAEKAKGNRTLFAQRRIKPEEVLPEWHRAVAALGGAKDVERFVSRAMVRLGAPLGPRASGGFNAVYDLPDDVVERLVAEGVHDARRIDFHLPPARGCRYIHRSHPLPAAMADALLERTLSGDAAAAAADPAILGRCGVWVADGLEAHTTVVLLRLRHQLGVRFKSRSHAILVEEAAAFGWAGRDGDARIDAEAALARLALPSGGDVADSVRARELERALARVAGADDILTSIAQGRAQALLEDHRRVRDAAGARGNYAVEALLPADVVGVYVLLPKLS